LKKNTNVARQSAKQKHPEDNVEKRHHHTREANTHEPNLPRKPALPLGLLERIVYGNDVMAHLA
jgi:hypothetical protein